MSTGDPQRSMKSALRTRNIATPGVDNIVAFWWKLFTYVCARKTHAHMHGVLTRKHSYSPWFAEGCTEGCNVPTKKDICLTRKTVDLLPVSIWSTRSIRTS